MTNKKGSRTTFGNVRKLPSGRWQARYTGPDGHTHRAHVTFDTKGDELRYVAAAVRDAGGDVALVDVGTTGSSSGVDVTAADVAAHHPDGAEAVWSTDRGRAVSAMSIALDRPKCASQIPL